MFLYANLSLHLGMYIIQENMVSNTIIIELLCKIIVFKIYNLEIYFWRNYIFYNIVFALVFWSLIQNEFWIELQICGAVFRKFVIHSGKFQVNSDWLIKTGFWCWILEWLPNIQLIFLSTDSLQFLILFLPIFYQFLQHYSAKKMVFFLSI